MILLTPISGQPWLFTNDLFLGLYAICMYVFTVSVGLWKEQRVAVVMLAARAKPQEPTVSVCSVSHTSMTPNAEIKNN